MREREDFSNLQYLYLITMGRKTGLPREIEIWFVDFEGRLYLLAETYHRAQWVRNLIERPRVRVRLGGREFEGAARVLDEKLDQELWRVARDLAREKYGWGDGLPVEIVPDEPLY